MLSSSLIIAALLLSRGISASSRLVHNQGKGFMICTITLGNHGSSGAMSPKHGGTSGPVSIRGMFLAIVRCTRLSLPVSRFSSPCLRATGDRCSYELCSVLVPYPRLRRCDLIVSRRRVSYCRPAVLLALDAALFRRLVFPVPSADECLPEY